MRRRLLLLPVLALAAAGCVLPGPGPTEPKRTYMLQGAGADAAPAAGWPCLTLRIALPRAAPGFRTARMAYSDTERRLNYFAYHAWVGTPADMVAAATEAELDARQLFGGVISGSAGVQADYRLDADGLKLMQDFDGQASSTVFEIKVKLIDPATRELLESRTFRYRERASAANPEAGVAAANRAFQRYLDDLAVFLRDAFEPLGCPA